MIDIVDPVACAASNPSGLVTDKAAEGADDASNSSNPVTDKSTDGACDELVQPNIDIAATRKAQMNGKTTLSFPIIAS
jgi:hypothetical protein